MEVYHPLYGWGTVCHHDVLGDDIWDVTESDVVCRQLGFNGTKGSGYPHGRGSDRILLSNVQCIGNETFLWNCTHRAWGVRFCFNNFYVGVKCY